MTEEVARYGYLAVFVLMVLESACVPVPSEVTMLFGGALASAGFAAAGQELDLVWVALLGTLGNVVGSWIAYAAGAWGGRPLFDRFGKYLLIRPHEIELADHFFQKYGSATAFFSRLLPIVRTFISFPAGVARMNLFKFIMYSTAGAFIWSAALVWAGLQLGARWTDIRHALQPFDFLIAIIVVLLVVLFVWWRLGMPGRRREEPRANA